jgi:hypothetical protein
MSTFPAQVLSASLLFCAIASTHASAQPLSVPLEQNGISYVTGGIGEDEVKTFYTVAPKYNVRITLTAKSGHYLSDVDVRISAGTRSLLPVRNSRPFPLRAGQ